MNTKRILLIDDEAEFAEMIKMRLEANQYKVDVASDGTRGLDLAARIKPDLILLDVMMPGMDGFAVLRRLRKEPATQAIPVVMLTAKGEFKSITDAQIMGAADYLIKPCETEQLLKMILRYSK
jgi:DNA-binding response OmpR family regulator